ncbi:MAG TPA: CBS domain-containing protein [Polyangiaceae bacterium]|nr:CBS domain-containing protein [Polyangiaceae bacterium]
MDAEFSIIEAFAASHPEDVARVLEESDESGAAALLSTLGPGRAAPVIREMVPTLAARRLDRLPADEAARITEELGLDATAALLRRLSAAPRGAILDAVAPGTRERSLRALLAHAPDTAGALMDPLVLAVPEDIRVREALERVRSEPANAMFYVYVVGGRGQLVGVVNQRELMLAPADAVVRSIMAAPPERLPANASAQAIVAHPAWRRVHALPVVDRQGRFLGAIRYKTARRLEHELGRATKAPSPEVTARALAELYGLAFAGMGEWALTAVRGPSSGEGEAP